VGTGKKNGLIYDVRELLVAKLAWEDSECKFGKMTRSPVRARSSTIWRPSDVSTLLRHIVIVILKTIEETRLLKKKKNEKKLIKMYMCIQC
jgi:hypothetical protein